MTIFHCVSVTRAGCSTQKWLVQKTPVTSHLLSIASILDANQFICKYLTSLLLKQHNYVTHAKITV